MLKCRGGAILTLKDICESIIAGGDVPEKRWSLYKTDKYNVPIYSNGIEDKSLYGYTDIQKVNKDSVTISARGTIGFVELRKAPFYPIVRLICLTPKSDIVNPLFFEYLMKNTNFNPSGATINQLTIPDVENLKFTIPDLKTQNSIAEKIQNILLKIQELEEKIEQYKSCKNKILNEILN